MEQDIVAKPKEEFKRVDYLLQQVQSRILEKFKNFRVAFRKFDKNFDGSLDFREFIYGMTELGFYFSLSDYRMIFEAIDYNGTKVVDFYKFCLLDSEKSRIRENLLKEYKNRQGEVKDEGVMFRDGKIPKNKNPNAFMTDV